MFIKHLDLEIEITRLYSLCTPKKIKIDMNDKFDRLAISGLVDLPSDALSNIL